MSTAAVSNSSIYQQLQSYFQARRADVQQLGQDLQSGDLTDAQQEYSAIQTLGQSGPVPNGDAFFRSDRQQDFNAIGQALQSGDLASAQQAFVQLQDTFQPNGGNPAPVTAPVSASPTASGPEIVLNLANAPAGEQITIGLSNAGNGNEQVTISAANSQNQNPEQIILNVNQNSNEQIVLNLFNNTASTSTQSGGVSVTA